MFKLRYKLKEEDMDRLQDIFSNSDDGWWFCARMDEWVKTLEESEEEYYCECLAEWLNYLCCRITKN